MSDFEYASVVVSIVLALGIADILRFLADCLREPGRRRLYWVHLVWIFLLLQLHVEFWWRMWDFRDFVDVGPKLTFLLLGPAGLFVATRTLLPTSGGESDMEQLYFQRKTAFFVLVLLLNIWSMIASPLSQAGDSGESGMLAVGLTVFFMALFVACVLSSNRRLHQAVAAIVALMEMLEIGSRIVASA
jgi:hypothetical protein